MQSGAMVLIGLYDSPFTRRVAIALALRGLPFEHRAWSVGREFDRIREYSPLGRVPVLVLDDGEVLTESALILDWIESQPGEALMPVDALARRQALKLIGLASGAADKGIAAVLERLFHSPDTQSAALLARCMTQIDGALDALEQACSSRGGRWLVGEAMTLADITVACYVTFLGAAVPVDVSRWPALAAHVARCEALPVFRDHFQPFSAPVPAGAVGA